MRYQGGWWTIVGVVGDVRQTRLTSETKPTIYTPLAQRNDWGLSLLVRTAGARPASMAPAVRRVVGDTDGRVVVTSAASMSELVARSFAEERYRALLVSLFGVLATVLSAVGMFGVRATDPVTYVGIVALLASVGVLASWLPARRAGRIDLVTVLRSE